MELLLCFGSLTNVRKSFGIWNVSD